MPQLLYARHYDTTVDGFLFESADHFTAKAGKLSNCFGQPIEEFEICFIDGDGIDCALADAWRLNQANFPAFFRAAELWDDHQKLCFIIAVGECGYGFEPAKVCPDDFDVDIYELDSSRNLLSNSLKMASTVQSRNVSSPISTRMPSPVIWRSNTRRSPIQESGSCILADR